MMKRLNDNEIEKYTTSDLGVSTALVSLGYHLVALDKSSPNRAVFIFQNSADIISTVEEYWNGSLSVKAKSFFETQKWLKSRIYNE